MLLCLSSQDLVKIFGKEAVTYMSIDDKVRVPISLTAVTKQAPLMMDLDYRVKLPDHDFVKGSGHKLIPSVFPHCLIDHEGPKNIRIRSGKPDSSTARSHYQDIVEMFQAQPELQKPILILSVDGGRTG